MAVGRTNLKRSSLQATRVQNPTGVPEKCGYCLAPDLASALHCSVSATLLRECRRIARVSQRATLTKGRQAQLQYSEFPCRCEILYSSPPAETKRRGRAGGQDFAKCWVFMPGYEGARANIRNVSPHAGGVARRQSSFLRRCGLDVRAKERRTVPKQS